MKTTEKIYILDYISLQTSSVQVERGGKIRE